MPEPQDQTLKHIELVFLQDSALLQARGRKSEGLRADQTAFPSTLTAAALPSTGREAVGFSRT